MKRAPAALLACGLLLSGCDPTQALIASPIDLASARARWAAEGPDAYTMTQVRSCFCPEEYRGPYRVSVRGGTVTRVERNGQTLPADRALTVEALFALIENANARPAERIDATYDARLGYPTSVSIDYDARIADEEVAYTVSDLMAE